jgi:hypothetical protein
MKLTDKHVSEDTIDRLINHWSCATWQTADPVFATDNIKILLELKQRRSEDRQRDANK